MDDDGEQPQPRDNSWDQHQPDVGDYHWISSVTSCTTAANPINIDGHQYWNSMYIDVNEFHAYMMSMGAQISTEPKSIGRARREMEARVMEVVSALSTSFTDLMAAYQFEQGIGVHQDRLMLLGRCNALQ